MDSHEYALPGASGKALGDHVIVLGERNCHHLASGCQRPARLRLPAYGHQLDPRAEPVLLTAEWAIARNITDRGGVCLVCDFDPTHADLRPLRGREAWVLWWRDEAAARRLAVRVAAVAGSGFLIEARGLAHG